MDQLPFGLGELFAGSSPFKWLVIAGGFLIAGAIFKRVLKIAFTMAFLIVIVYVLYPMLTGMSP